MLKPAIFLDRDGTLNVEKHYLHRIPDWEWTDSAIASLKKLHQAGYALVVVTNQSGIARGYYTEAQLHELHRWVEGQLAAHHIPITGFYYCPHEPEITGDCECRKPKPGMLLQAAREHGLDLSRSWMIGDKPSDIEAGEAAGCRTILVRTGYGRDEGATLPSTQLAADNLWEATKFIL